MGDLSAQFWPASDPAGGVLRPYILYQTQIQAVKPKMSTATMTRTMRVRFIMNSPLSGPSPLSLETWTSRPDMSKDLFGEARQTMPSLGVNMKPPVLLHLTANTATNTMIMRQIMGMATRHVACRYLSGERCLLGTWTSVGSILCE